MTTRVGILGGGQLSRMLIESAHRLGLKFQVYASNASEPAAQLCPTTFYGSASDPIALRTFLSQCDRVIFENEFLDIQVLRQASAGLSVQFVPDLDVMGKFQDKLTQKEILLSHGLATAPFEVWKPAQGSAEAWLKQVHVRFKGQFVLKWSRGGYDGKGTWISPGDQSSALAFIEEGGSKNAQIYAEEKIPFLRELALVSFASVTDEFKTLPLVISEQESGVCRLVQGPATALGVSAQVEQKTQEMARKLVQAFGLQGAFAIEFFETSDGKIWVNEIAPRVHNSGHFSMTACLTSQFENHWRAILGLPLGDVHSFPFFAMWNLLGPKGTDILKNVRPPEACTGIQLHWYGKNELRSGRKMGHFNSVATNASELQALIQKMKEQESKWLKNLKPA